MGAQEQTDSARTKAPYALHTTGRRPAPIGAGSPVANLLVDIGVDGLLLCKRANELID